ncbi:hypothetical protein LI221_11845 [Faecalimonas umbilicata]|nr:hypothetical protein [Faecalimonas umbilicata]
MITKRSQGTKGLLVKAGFRPAGKMDKDGKTISWEDAYQIVLLPFEEDKGVKKYTIDSNYTDEIMAKLETIHWGCLVELEFANKKVIALNIVDDVLKNFYEAEE